MVKLIRKFFALMSLPWSFIILGFTGILASSWALATAEKVDGLTVVNLAISLATMIIGQAGLVAGRTDALAFHLKMDLVLEVGREILEFLKQRPVETPGIGAEHEPEEVIAKELRAVEERAK